MAEESDKIHRLLFGFPSMVEQLVRSCLPESTIEGFDFSTLEPASERQLTEQGDLRRDGDLFWKLMVRPPEGEPHWVHLNLEHKSTPSRWAGLDMATYQVTDWQKQVRSGEVGRGKLSPTLSLVVYTGDKPWRRAKPLRELVHPLDPATPGLEVGDFVLLDIQRHVVHIVTTPFDAFVKLHQLKAFEEVASVIRDLRPMVADNEKMAQAFVGLINDEILRRMAKKGEKTVRIKSLEDTTMLAQRIERIKKGYIEEGERKGKREGESKIFLKLYAVKNGGSVPKAVRERVSKAKLKQLETWAERLLTVERAEDIFDD